MSAATQMKTTNNKPAKTNGPDRGDPSKAQVSIRLAQNQDDIAAMMALGHMLHAESGYRSLPVVDERMAEMAERGLKDGNPGLFIAERNGQVIGMAVAVLGEYFFSPARTATVQMLYVHPDARGSWAAIKLLRTLHKWAKQNDAHDLHVNVTTGIDTARTDRFLRTMGFRQTGGNYVFEGLGA